MAIWNDRAFVARGSYGLDVLDITDPGNMFLTAYGSDLGGVYDCFVISDMLFAGCYDAGFKIIDLENPDSLIILGSYDTPGTAYRVEYHDNLVYVADGNALRIYDAQDVANLEELGSFVVGGGGYVVDFVLQYPLIFVSKTTAGFFVVDVSDPSAPQSIGSYNTNGAVHGMSLLGGYLYVADHSNGVGIFNCSDPANPFLIGSIVLPGFTWVTRVVDNLLYVTNGNIGTNIYSLVNPEDPQLVGWYSPSSGEAVGIWITGTQFAVAERDRVSLYELVGEAPNSRILYPNSGESLLVYSADTIKWEGDAFGTMLSIEINCLYPNGPWQVIADSTENDGEYEWLVTNPLSDSCRIRICALTDTFCDVSDGNFSIVSTQGYLALVRSAQPNVLLTDWSYEHLECPQTTSEWFRFKNFGSEAIVVFQPLEPVSSEFTMTTNCGTFFALTPNQVSACSVQVAFDPASAGLYSGVLQVQTDAVNGVNGFVEFGLTGEQISTPAAPNVVIQRTGLDVNLLWAEVDTSIGGCPVSDLWYAVFYSPTEGGPFYFHGWTADTAYTHYGVVNFSAMQFYSVMAMSAPTAVAGTLCEGTPKEEVVSAIRRMKDEKRRTKEKG